MTSLPLTATQAAAATGCREGLRVPYGMPHAHTRAHAENLHAHTHVHDAWAGSPHPPSPIRAGLTPSNHNVFPPLAE